MTLTKAQQALLDAIKAHGFIHSIAWHCSRTTSVPGYPHRVTDAMLTALRRAKRIESRVIRPGQSYPNGRINEYRVGSTIYVPTLDPGHYVEIVETKTGKVVKRTGPHDERSAERIERGAAINLNHEEYHTEIRKV